MGRGKSPVARQKRRRKSVRDSSKSYSHRAPPPTPSIPVTSALVDDGGNPLAGWTDLHVFASELAIPYRDLRRNVPRLLVRKLGRTLYVQRPRFVAWWLAQDLNTVLP